MGIRGDSQDSMIHARNTPGTDKITGVDLNPWESSPEKSESMKACQFVGQLESIPSIRYRSTSSSAHPVTPRETRK